jgi:hypothetical protein
MTTVFTFLGLVSSFVLVLLLALLLAPDQQRTELTRQSLCEEASIVFFIQQQQFKRAQEEISKIEECPKGDKKKPATDRDALHRQYFNLFRKELEISRHRTDGLFYAHSFGGVITIRLNVLCLSFI